MRPGGIAENLVADVIFLLILILLGWVIYLCTSRAQLLKFYGVDASRRIVIYVSNLRVTCGGAIGIDGRRRSYQGSAAPFGEMLVANRFRDLFNYFLPSLADKPGVLSRLLISDVQVELLPSPLSQGQLEGSSSFITLGGPAYNAASGFVETKLHSQARFKLGKIGSHPFTETPVGTHLSDGDTGVEVPPTYSKIASALSSSSSRPVPSPPSSSNSGYPIDELNSQDEPTQAGSAIIVEDVPPIADTSFGFVERIVDHEQRRCIFYCAGLSELGTVGAAHFLATEWARLHKKYGSDTPFVVMLRIGPTDFRRWSIAFER